jgi:hypothetical protein
MGVGVVVIVEEGVDAGVAGVAAGEIGGAGWGELWLGLRIRL